MLARPVELQQIELALLGAAPALVAMAIVDFMDAKRPEPRSTLRRVALAGAISALPVVLVGEILKQVGPTAGYAGALWLSFVIAAIPEEAAKLASVFLMAWRRPEFDERMDGIVYGARAGLGFALVENVAYLLLLPHSFSEYLQLYVARAVLAVPGHAIWGGVAGYFAARRRFDGRGPGLWGGFGLAVLMHGLYDAWVFCAPVAIADGHLWLASTVAGIPVVIYAGPAIIILLGAMLLRSLAQRAIADDDADEAAMIGRWAHPHRHHASGHTAR
ncbi:PrsW family intramembrane metalloprotease [Paraliomyxa miuraensis]|uniref:PrsW family intramembrane metalloprotease n=1 Tax=Paraliomyxa miuraensis TaxID=376150 RepID=UPI00224E7926|nr:PrsW family intramembrane metalloprotease [Paraliomyxa miuraensis]MCX4243592.1 PrsW family intramembrane metalloprotease [Paraliomyxa miuraensis]